MSIVEILTIILPSIFGGGILTFLIQKRKENRDDFKALLEIYREDNDRLRLLEKENAEMIRRLNERCNQLERRIHDLQSKMMILESAHMDATVPMWLKDRDGTMIALNSKYEEVFLKPNGKSIGDYIGKKDHDVWPREIADQFRANDRIAEEVGFIDTIEKVTFGERVEEWRIIKYARKIGNLVIGVGGIAIPIKPLNHEKS